MSVKVTVPNGSSDYLTFGSANTPVAAQIGGYDDGSSAGHMEFYTTASGASTERMRIDASGNVGIGTASPSTKFQVAGTSGSPQFQAGTASNGYFQINAFDSNPVYCVVAGTNATAGVFGTQSNIPTIFFTNNTERMRIDSSGNVLVGTTSGTGYKVRIKSGNGDQLFLDNAGETYTQLFFANNGNIKADQYFENSTTRFYIRCNSAGGVYLASGGTSWTSASDARVKDIIEPIDNAVQKLESWQTVIGKYKTDEEGTRRPFLIAQDVLATFPEAVDTTNEEEYGLRYQDTIPLLVAAIQEQQAIITDLKSRIEALESK